jgi:hypothetical protein
MLLCLMVGGHGPLMIGFPQYYRRIRQTKLEENPILPLDK